MQNVFLVGGAIVLSACSRSESAPSSAAATAAPSLAPVASAPASNDGKDPHRPILSADDATFADTRRGWGWSDRCWNEEHAGMNGWAMAACQKGLDLPVTVTSLFARCVFTLFEKIVAVVDASRGVR
jgi:hypothetical protein